MWVGQTRRAAAIIVLASTSSGSRPAPRQQPRCLRVPNTSRGKPQRGGIESGPGETLDQSTGSVAIRCSQNAIKQSSQTASFRGMSSIRSRSRRPMGHPSHMAQACDLRPGNRMTLFMAAPKRHLILTLRSVKFKLNFCDCSTKERPPIELTGPGSGAKAMDIYGTV